MALNNFTLITSTLIVFWARMDNRDEGEGTDMKLE